MGWLAISFPTLQWIPLQSDLVLQWCHCVMEMCAIVSKKSYAAFCFLGKFKHLNWEWIQHLLHPVLLCNRQSLSLGSILCLLQPPDCAGVGWSLQFKLLPDSNGLYLSVSEWTAGRRWWVLTGKGENKGMRSQRSGINWQVLATGWVRPMCCPPPPPAPHGLPP